MISVSFSSWHNTSYYSLIPLPGSGSNAYDTWEAWRIQSGQKGLYPPNIGDQCSNCWLLLLITNIQTKRCSTLLFHLIHVCKLLSFWLKWLPGYWEGQHLPCLLHFFFSLSPSEHQTLKTDTFKISCIYWTIRKSLHMPKETV